MSSPEASPERLKKNKLAVAIAKGTSIAVWAKANEVPPRTAYRWSADAKVRANAEKLRRRALDRAIGRMSHSVNWATEHIHKLAKEAVSESVRLAALRTIFSSLMSVSEFADLKDRITQLEEQLNERERAGHTGQAG